jgi:single-stranded-DNA-specific exonuclease
MDPKARWQVLSRKHDNLFEHLCLSRGVVSEDLIFDYEKNLHDPFLLPDMETACKLVGDAKRLGWHVTIFGDYDADGTPASALLSIALKRLDIPHSVILPTRKEGYGIKKTHIEKISERSQLLITVDTGISAIEETKLAKEKGMKVIILDHHLPKEILPDADAVIDPFIEGSTYPFKGLCGCALAYKLVEALAKYFPNEFSEGFRKWLLDLVAVSTVADMMPITGENRALVYYGLQVLKKNRRLGLKHLLLQAQVEPSTLSASTLGFVIGPRLNASGRLSDNRPVLELLLSENPSEAEALALQLEQANKERQKLVKETIELAKGELFSQNSPDDFVYVVVGEDWPAGVLGLVAGKLAAHHFRPVIVANKVNGIITGSARSIGDYSIVEGLTSQEKLLRTFGGHRQAAGLSLEERVMDDFRMGLKNHAKQFLTEEQLVPTFRADAVLGEEDLSQLSIEQYEKFQPFGIENPQPIFIVKDVVLDSPRFMGASKDHVKWAARKGGKSVDAIGFGMASRLSGGEALESADLLGYLELNTWNGKSSLQMRLLDFAPSGKHIEEV